MTRKIAYKLLIGAALLTGCGTQLPDDIIQPAQMENILYDYHLALGMGSNVKSSENYQREAYKKYIFKKHHITEAEFDSSMVWYSRNTKELSTIYENLSKRFKREKEHISRLLDGREEKSEAITAYGDTVDIWRNKTLYWLTDAPLANQLTFEIKADSNFHIKDAFEWKADYIFLAGGNATVGMSIVYENDSIIGETRTLTQSGKQTLYLHTDSAYQIKSIHGFIHAEADSTASPSILISNLSLIRYHQMNDSVTVAPIMPQGKEETPQAKQAEPQKLSEPVKNNQEPARTVPRRARRATDKANLQVQERE